VITVELRSRQATQCERNAVVHQNPAEERHRPPSSPAHGRTSCRRCVRCCSGGGCSVAVASFSRYAALHGGCYNPGHCGPPRDSLEGRTICWSSRRPHPGRPRPAPRPAARANEKCSTSQTHNWSTNIWHVFIYAVIVICFQAPALRGAPGASALAPLATLLLITFFQKV